MFVVLGVVLHKDIFTQTRVLYIKQIPPYFLYAHFASLLFYLLPSLDVYVVDKFGILKLGVRDA